VPGETTTMGLISMSGGECYVGDGTTFTTYEQSGDYTVTTMNVTGGTVNCNHIKTSSNAITTLNLTAGTVDATKSREARTWATVNSGEYRDTITITVKAP